MQPGANMRAGKAITREMIIHAANEIFLAEGLDKISIRALAARIQHSVGTIYLYFKGKTELILALIEHGFQKLHASLRQTGMRITPLLQLKTIGRIYLDFGLENPKYYHLMFMLDIPASWKAGHTATGKQALHCLRRTIQACINTGCIRFQYERYATLAVWSLLHGLLTLWRLDGLSPSQRKKVAKDMHGIFANFISAIAVKKF